MRIRVGIIKELLSWWCIFAYHKYGWKKDTCKFCGKTRDEISGSEGYIISSDYD